MRIALLTLFSIAVLAAADPQPASADPTSKPAWAAAMGKDQFGTWSDLVVKGVTQRFRLIPAGTFTMGCDDAETDAVWNEAKQKYPQAQYQRATFETHQHTVTLTQEFWMEDSAESDHDNWHSADHDIWHSLDVGFVGVFPERVSGPQRGLSGNGKSGNRPSARTTSTLDPCARRA